jgi:hypothetical protein
MSHSLFLRLISRQTTIRPGPGGLLVRSSRREISLSLVFERVDKVHGVVLSIVSVIVAAAKSRMQDKTVKNKVKKEHKMQAQGPLSIALGHYVIIRSRRGPGWGMDAVQPASRMGSA